MDKQAWLKNYPSEVPHEISFEKITMPELLARNAECFPDTDALVYMGTRISYRELDVLVNRFARVLMDLGLSRGDTVAMLLPNIPQVVIANYAAFRIGCTIALNNPLYTERELAYQLNDSDATALVCLDLLVPRVMNIIGQTKIRDIIVCHINDYLPFPLKQLFPLLKRAMFRKVETGEGRHEFMDLLDQQSDDPVENRARWEDVGALLYTGGTTGPSKGAMLTHENMYCNAVQLIRWFPGFKDGEERSLAVFPFFHSAGFTGVQNGCMLKAWTDILVPRPEPDNVADMIRKFKPTIVPGVPTIFIGLLNNEKFCSADLSFIKAFIAGAAPLSMDTIKRLKDLTGGDIVNIYGLTEISPMGTATPWKGLQKPGTVGVPLPNTEVKIVDVDTGTTEMPGGEAGEILFRGPQVMKGYYKKPEETTQAIRDGWVYTGDIGFMDEEGFLTIVDRKKDMIVAAGFNIFPQEIDEILFDHPAVLEACCIGIPDEYRGESVKAYIVVRPGESLGPDEVKQYCREKLAAYKVPREIEFIDELPKSAVGKILRRQLRELDREKREGRKSA